MSLPATQNEEQVRAVMQRYVQAVYEADIESLRDVFHGEAFMGGYLGDDLLMGTPEPFFADVGGRPSMAEERTQYTSEITSLEVQGRAASVTLREDGFFGTHRFVNYFTLIEVEGRWKIASKTFASLSA